MKILFLSQCYEPEIAAATTRVSGLARLWVKNGHEVTVLTGFPNYPLGQRFPDFDYGNRIFKRDIMDGIEVIRTYNLFYRSGQSIRRGLDGLSMMLSSVISLNKIKKSSFDVVIGTSPHSFLLPSTVYIAKKLAIPSVLDIRDHWPESVPGSRGRLSKHIWKLIGKTVSYSYPRADMLVCVSPDYLEYASKYGITRDKFAVVYNGFDEARFSTHISSLQARQQLGIPNHGPVVSFIGTMGESMGFDNLINACSILSQRFRQEDLPQALFLFAGSGSHLNFIKNLCEKTALNCLFLPPMASSEVYKAYAASDISVASLENLEEHKHRIPAKTFEILGTGTPMLGIVPQNGSAWKLLEESGGAMLCSPGNPESAADALYRIITNSDLSSNLSCSGKAFIKSSYTREIMADKYIEILEQLIKRK